MATLTSGFGSLSLILTDPGRDDLASVKVWASTIQGFIPGPGTLVYEGKSLNITISNLPVNTTYYVKYAYISEIDTTTYDVSTTDLVATTASIDHTAFNDDFFVLNADNTDIDVELRFARNTGGSASFIWNGSKLQCSRPFISQELGINNISATEPTNPFAKQIWLDTSQ